MAAYVIVDIEVIEPVEYERYKSMAQTTIAKYGGEYVVRGGKAERAEGDWTPKRLVILRFESAARARQWLESPEYAPARELRHRTARSNMVIVEGL
jgi:uncharacterized protein (DUF1330 family)